MQLACLHAVAGRLDDALTALKSAAGAGVDPVAAARRGNTEVALNVV